MDANFRNRIENRLKANKMTQKQLAEKLGVSEVTVSRWLSGDRNPSMDTIEQIANILGTTPSYFFLKDNAIEQASEPATNSKQSSGLSTSLKVTFGVILGLVITAVAAGILSKDEKEKLVDVLEGADILKGGK